MHNEEQLQANQWFILVLKKIDIWDTSEQSQCPFGSSAQLCKYSQDSCTCLIRFIVQCYAPYTCCTQVAPGPVAATGRTGGQGQDAAGVAAGGGAGVVGAQQGAGGLAGEQQVAGGVLLQPAAGPVTESWLVEALRRLFTVSLKIFLH